MIEEIDPFRDASAIEEIVSIRKNCILNFIIANILLKKGAKEGLNLYEIGTIMYKDYNQ